MSEPRAEAHSPILRGCATVAVVEGDADARDMLAILLEQRVGVAAPTCGLRDVQRGGVDWPAWIREHDPDAILWDLPHPYAHAVAFLRLVCTSSTVAARPFIVLTTNALAVGRELDDCPAEHVVAVLQKPFSARDLLNAIIRASVWRKARLARGTTTTPALIVAPG